jgi:hypothetical protein
MRTRRTTRAGRPRLGSDRGASGPLRRRRRRARVSPGRVLAAVQHRVDRRGLWVGVAVHSQRFEPLSLALPPLARHPFLRHRAKRAEQMLGRIVQRAREMLFQPSALLLAQLAYGRETRRRVAGRLPHRHARRISENRQRQASIRSALEPTLRLAVRVPDLPPIPGRPIRTDASGRVDTSLKPSAPNMTPSAVGNPKLRS